jgi:quercetin dioxygenase-like cupin family protein
MQIIRAADQDHRDGPAEHFTGEVDMLALDGPGALLVRFAPSARTAWHTHPHGQTLYVVSGVARIGREGSAVEQAHAGDTVRFEPGERHWHGASPEGLMAHVALARTDEKGLPTYWEGHVSDEEYGDSPSRDG